MKRKSAIPKAFGKCKLLVVGDIMLDRYIFGSVSRLAPEAPVPVMALRWGASERYYAGGAANAACNAAALGAKVTLVSSSALRDDAGDHLRSLIRRAGVVDNSSYGQSRTITKTRYCVDDRIMFRVDDERHGYTVDDKVLLANLRDGLAWCDAVLISDYAKGIVSCEVLRMVALSGKPIVIDPKPRSHCNYADIMRRGKVIAYTPNRAEAVAMFGMDYSDMGELAERLAARMHAGIVLTCGAQGIYSATHGDRCMRADGYHTRACADATGAGDTVAAVIALGAACGMNLHAAARLANLAASMTLGTMGPGVVKIDALRRAAEC